MGTLEERLKEAFWYEADTGLLYSRYSRTGAHVHGPAGCKEPDGYVRVMFEYQRFLAHNLAWFLHYGVWPKQHIDHINGIRDDNRIINLRDVSHRENCANMAVHRNGKRRGTSLQINGRWQARITVDNRAKSLGQFDTEEEAEQAYLAAVAALARGDTPKYAHP